MPTSEGLTLLQALVIVAAIVVIVIVLFPVVFQYKTDGKDPTLSNLKQCGLSALMYAGDHDDRYPRAHAWIDEEYPYLKRYSIFHDPSMPSTDEYGFAFRNAASAVKQNEIRLEAAFVIQFQTVLAGPNAHSDLWSLPMPGRNGKADAVCFADGRVRSIGTPPGDPTQMQKLVEADAMAGPIGPGTAFQPESSVVSRKSCDID